MGEYLTSIPSLAWTSVHKALVKAEPRSLVTRLGSLKIEAQCNMNDSLIACAVGDVSATCQENNAEHTPGRNYLLLRHKTYTYNIYEKIF